MPTTSIKLTHGSCSEINFQNQADGGASNRGLSGLDVEPTMLGVRIQAVSEHGRRTKTYIRIPYEDVDEVIAALQKAKTEGIALTPKE